MEGTDPSCVRESFRARPIQQTENCPAAATTPFLIQLFCWRCTSKRKKRSGSLDVSTAAPNFSNKNGGTLFGEKTLVAAIRHLSIIIDFLLLLLSVNKSRLHGGFSSRVIRPSIQFTWPRRNNHTHS